MLHNSNALAMPVRRGRKNDDPESGTNPILTKTSIKVASSEATTISQANASEQPAPAATPFNRPTTGFGKLRIARMIGLYRFCSDSRKDLFPSPTVALPEVGFRS